MESDDRHVAGERRRRRIRRSSVRVALNESLLARVRIESRARRFMLTSLIALAVVSSASIQLDRDSNGDAVVRIVDGAAGWVEIFVEGVNNAPAMLGESRIVGKDLIFVPRYPLRPGQKYRVKFKDSTTLSKVIDVPAKATATGSFVEHIYPSADTLPA